ncbi:hypothetical protein GCM10007094_08400 [Pseudovibrio japonicus]|uniref:Lipoprotein n=1 Tax=Pseudovibrio japonicus TaxID=366534 RepID=A0ABQ3E3U9_9HYPH|nr:hypothetical protein [Pseudovibrio japonicus]GHB22551.1 hypothetical protein GCM10007094_08400 [Pseudovibrio japonicus]
MQRNSWIIGSLLAVSIVGTAYAEDMNLTDQQLEAAIQSRLTDQLGSAEEATRLSDFLMREVLTWKPAVTNIDDADSIIAYAFGNRLDAHGNRLPGPMNQQLADVVVDIYNEIHKPVYAQWEIAEEIGDRIPAADLVSIEPLINDNGDVVYLSTRGVAEEVVQHVGGADNLGTAVVVGFYEHHLRTVETSRALGINAFGPEGYPMPHNYDADSGQPWTRDAANFILYEVAVRAGVEREQLTNAQDN